MDEKRKPIDIEILQLPAITIGQYGLPINFFDLLCAIKYDDGTREFMESPHIEFSYPDVPGTYKVYIYLDENHSYGIKKWFKIRIIPSNDQIDQTLKIK